MATSRGPSPPRATIWFIIVWNVVIMTVLVVVIARHAAWALLPYFVIPPVAMLAVIVWRRRRSSSASQSASSPRGRLTGTVVTRAATGSIGGDSAPPRGRWVGSGTFPGWLGPMEATTPMAVLEVAEGTVRFRLRPRVLAVMFGVTPLVAAPHDIDEVFPASRRLREGIGLRHVDGPTYYLWTIHREAVLTALEASRFHVSWDERVFTRR